MSGPRLTTVLRLAVAGGRADRVRVTLTAIAAALGTVALLAAASVALIRSGDGPGPYRLQILAQPGLRPGTTVAILLLLVPLTVFIGHCFRLGASTRDRRLAAMRMAGATPADATRIVVAETFLAAVAGSAVGAAAFWLLRLRLDRPDADGRLLLPTDVWMPLALVALVALVIPVTGAAASVLALRRVLIGPFGVTRRVPSRPPTLTPVVLFLGGSGGLLAFQAVAAALGLNGGTLPVLLLAFVLFVMTAAGLLMGTASLAAAMGRFLAPRVSSPALLIAARRMIAAPHTASRSSSAVLIAVLIGGGVQGTRESFLLATDPSDPFYRDTFTLVNGVLVVALAIAAAGLLVVTAESMVERRRTLAALTAGGTPRGVLARAALAEVLLPLAPAVLLASVAGVLAARGSWGAQVSIDVGQIDPVTAAPAAEARVLDVPVPWDRVLALGGGAILVCALMTALSLVFLRRSTDPAELRVAA